MLRRALPSVISLSLLLLACGDDTEDTAASATGGGGEPAGGAAPGGGGQGGDADGGNGGDGGDGGIGGTGGSGGTGGAGQGGASAHACDTTFTGADGSAWPAHWSETGEVAQADIQGNRGRFSPSLSGYSLARLDCAGTEENVEVLFNLSFTDVSTQGLGFYTRQNGGYLAQTTPAGEGYAVFIEGFSGQPGVGVWYERNGDENEIADAPFSLQNGTIYWVRFRVEQEDASNTRLRARIWVDGDTEPATWLLDELDDQAGLQGISGGFVVDAWSTHNPGDGPAADQFFDELTITPLP